MLENFSSQRIIDAWNKLEKDIVACHSVSTFKKHLDKYILNEGFM